MTNYERVHDPLNQSGKSSALSENQIPGWVEGIITSVTPPSNRPDLQGCVKVQCPTISNMLNLPLEEGVWARVGERWTLNETPGGTHRPLEVGLQVELKARFGDPRQLLVGDCIPSIVDPPAPHTDRANGLSGSVSRNGVMKLENDSESSLVHSYPHGAKIHIKPTGDILHQTRDGATSLLKQDGSIRVQNMEGAFDLSKDGGLTLQNSTGAITSISPGGSIDAVAASGGTLSLSDGSTSLLGPGSAGSAMKQSLGSTLNALTAVKSGGSQATPVLTQAIEAVSKLQDFSLSSLATELASTVEQALSQGLPEFNGALNALLTSSPLGDIPARLQSILPNGKNCDTATAEELVQTLGHNPKRLAAAITEEVFGDIIDLESIRDIASPMRQIQGCFESGQLDAIPNLLPAELRSAIAPTSLQAAAASSTPIAHLLGSVRATQAGNLKNSLNESATAPGGPTQSMVQGAIAQIAPLIQATPGSGGSSTVELVPGQASLNCGPQSVSVTPAAVKIGGGGGGASMSLSASGGEMTSPAPLTLKSGKKEKNSGINLREALAALTAKSDKGTAQATITPEQILMQCPGVVRVEAGNQDSCILTNGLHTVEATPEAVLVDGKDVLKMLQEKQRLIEEQQRLIEEQQQQLGVTNDKLALANQDLASLRQQLAETQNQLTATNKAMITLKDEIFLLGAANWIPLKSLTQPTT